MSQEDGNKVLNGFMVCDTVSGSQEWCVVCIDMPGHGLSSHLTKGIPYSSATDLQAIRSLVKHVGRSRFHLIGK